MFAQSMPLGAHMYSRGCGESYCALLFWSCFGAAGKWVVVLRLSFFQLFLSLLASCVVSVTPCDAQQYIDYIELRVLGEAPGPDVPLYDLIVEAYDSASGDFIGSTSTYSDGWATIYPYGQFSDLSDITLKFLTTQSSTCSNCNLFVETQTTVSLDTTSPDFYYDSASFSLNLTPGGSGNPPYVLARNTHFFVVKVTDGPGSPIEDVYVNACDWQNSYQCISGQTNSDGEAFLPRDPNDTSTWTIDIWGEGISGDIKDVQADPTKQLQNVLFNVQTADASLTVNLVDGNNQPWSFPAGACWGEVSCYRLGQSGFSAYETLATGDTSVTLPVIGGIYECSIYGNTNSCENTEYAEIAGSLVTVNVSPQESKTVSIQIQEKTAQINVQILDDETGELVTGDFDISMWTLPDSSVNDWNWTTTSDGTATLDAIDGVSYQLSVWFLGGTTDTADRKLTRQARINGTEFIHSNELYEVTAIEGTAQDVIVRLKKPDATLTVQLNRPDGTPVQSGYADLWCPGQAHDFEDELPGGAAADEEEDQDFFIGAPIVNGSAILNVIADRTCFLSAFPDWDPNADPEVQYLPPQSKEIRLEEGEARTETLIVAVPNYTITVDVTVLDEDGNEVSQDDLSSLFCFAHNSQGQHSFVDVLYEQKNTLVFFIKNKKKPLPIKVGCNADDYDPDSYDSESGAHFYFGEIIHTPTKKTSSGQVALTIQEGGEFLPEEQFTFDADKSKDVQFAGGKFDMTIPSGAFCSSGNAALSIESARNTTQDDDAELLSAFDISPVCDGESISNTEKPVTLCWPIDETGLPAGATTDNIYAASYNSDTGKWTKDGSGEYNAETGEFCASVSHFSKWAALISTVQSLMALELDDVKLRVNRNASLDTRGRKKVKMTWDEPEGADATTEYTVRYRVMSKKKNCTAENLTKSKSVIGKTKTKIKAKKYSKKGKNNGICAVTSVSGGNTTEPKFKRIK